MRSFQLGFSKGNPVCVDRDHPTNQASVFSCSTPKHSCGYWHLLHNPTLLAKSAALHWAVQTGSSKSLLQVLYLHENKSTVLIVSTEVLLRFAISFWLIRECQTYHKKSEKTSQSTLINSTVIDCCQRKQAHSNLQAALPTYGLISCPLNSVWQIIPLINWRPNQFPCREARRCVPLPFSETQSCSCSESSSASHTFQARQEALTV